MSDCNASGPDGDGTDSGDGAGSGGAGQTGGAENGDMGGKEPGSFGEGYGGGWAEGGGYGGWAGLSFEDFESIVNDFLGLDEALSAIGELGSGFESEDTSSFDFEAAMESIGRMSLDIGKALTDMPSLEYESITPSMVKLGLDLSMPQVRGFMDVVKGLIGIAVGRYGLTARAQYSGYVTNLSTNYSLSQIEQTASRWSGRTGTGLSAVTTALGIGGIVGSLVGNALGLAAYAGLNDYGFSLVSGAGSPRADDSRDLSGTFAGQTSWGETAAGEIQGSDGGRLSIEAYSEDVYPKTPVAFDEIKDAILSYTQSHAGMSYQGLVHTVRLNASDGVSTADRADPFDERLWLYLGGGNAP